jgi:hypothetical protein
MKANLGRRIAVLEAKMLKSPVISTWVDFILWLDGGDEDVEVELCPELQMLVQEVLSESNR